MQLGIDDPIEWLNAIDPATLHWWMAYYCNEPWDRDTTATAVVQAEKKQSKAMTPLEALSALENRFK